MFEIGNSLREARIRRGIEFPQAEAAIKIRGKYLRALEDEQFELLPAETYVKGFLRTYAEYLGLDGQLYVDEFNSRFVTGEDNEARRARIEALDLKVAEETTAAKFWNDAQIDWMAADTAFKKAEDGDASEGGE